MSILIRGMEMPENCAFCKFAENIDCFLKGRSTYAGPGCPLVEIEDNKLYIMRDGTLYVTNIELPKGNLIILPPIEISGEE